MSNSPFEPEKHSRYGAYQPSDPYTPPAYQPIDPYSAPTYQTPNPYSASPYAPTDPYAAPPPIPPASPYTPPPGSQTRNKLFLIVGITAVLVIVSAGGLYAALRNTGGITSATATTTPPTPTAILPTPTAIPPTPTAMPSPTPQSSSYPAITNAYSGSVHNTTYNKDADMALTAIKQNKDALNGNIKFGLPLVGSGAFTGNVTTSNAIHFVVSSGDLGGVTLTFDGSVLSDGSMSGAYTVSNGQQGTWKANKSANPVVYPILYHNYSGSFLNTKTNQSANITIQITTQNQQSFTGMFAAAIAMTGTVGSDNSIQFSIKDAKGVSTKFTGTVNIDGSLSGTFASASGGAGTWNVAPAQQ